jgi:hypothetical protein
MYELWKGVLFRAGFFAWWPGALRILRSVLRDIENMTPWTRICHLSLEIGIKMGIVTHQSGAIVKSEINALKQMRAVLNALACEGPRGSRFRDRTLKTGGREVMAIEGWYYLHQNGDLIYKRELGSTVADLRESNFVKGVWPFDPGAREMAWNILVEALAADAKPTRVFELADKWQCDDVDAHIYAEHVGCLLAQDGNKKTATHTGFINIQESDIGFGDTYLEAMAELCRDLGYKPSKMWGATFKDLLG